MSEQELVLLSVGHFSFAILLSSFEKKIQRDEDGKEGELSSRAEV